MAQEKKKLTTSARPVKLETLTNEEAAKVNGGRTHKIYGLIIRHHHRPIYGLVINPGWNIP